MKICEPAFQLRQTIAPFSSLVISGLLPEFLSTINSSEFEAVTIRRTKLQKLAQQRKGDSQPTFTACMIRCAGCCTEVSPLLLSPALRKATGFWPTAFLRFPDKPTKGFYYIMDLNKIPEDPSHYDQLT